MSSQRGSMYSGTVYLASDHAGFALRHFVADKLRDAGIKFVDLGAPMLNPTDDYPDFIEPAAARVSIDPASRAIIFGKSGQGEAMNANRFHQVRAAVWDGGPLEIVKLAREHNDANILSIGAGFVTEEEAWGAVQLFLNTPFSGDERHARRIQKLDD